MHLAFVGGKGLLCCKSKYIVHIIELSYVFKIGKMKVDNLVALTLVFTHLDLCSLCHVQISL